jgi:predicted DNA-binding transcriptional regulator AlpA
MDILATKQVSALTGVSEPTLRYWRHLGIGPVSFKLGRRVVYRRGAVERWIEEQEKATSRGDNITVVA